MASEKIKLRDIFNRNLILIMIIQVVSDCSNNWASAYINMGAKAAGVSAMAIGLGASVYTVAALIMRMPAGAIADSEKKRIGLIISIIIRSITIFLLSTFGTLGDANYIVARALYGVGWCLVGIILPATVAMMMDKKVMGTTYAFLSVAQALCKNYSKAGGVYVYQNLGVIPAVLGSIGFAVLAIVLIMFLDFNDERIIRSISKKKKKGIFGTLNLKYIPVCFLMSLVILGYTTHREFNNVVAAERGIDLSSILVVTGTIASVISFFTNALCDFIHPKYVLFFLYTCLAAGLLLTSQADTYGVFLVAEGLCTIGISYSKIISIYLYKVCDPTEKGTVHATNYFATDILSIVFGTVSGAIITALGFSGGYVVIAIFTMAVALFFLFASGRMMQDTNVTE